MLAASHHSSDDREHFLPSMHDLVVREVQHEVSGCDEQGVALTIRDELITPGVELGAVDLDDETVADEKIAPLAPRQ